MAGPAGCGADGDAPGYPTRDWSGHYQTRMTGSSTDCHGADLPPPLTGFTMLVTQHPNNRAEIVMGPFIRLRGSFDGDSLEAGHATEAPIDLPDSIARRATGADSLETIRYAMRLGFTGQTARGTYIIRTPDINALARGEGPGRCTFRYEVSGIFAEDVPTLPRARPAPPVEADTAGAADG